MELDFASLSYFIRQQVFGARNPATQGPWFNSIDGSEHATREEALLSAHNTLRVLGLRPADTRLDDAQRLYQSSL